MGWTGQHAEHYKNGIVDRKAECDAYFLEGLNRGFYEVLKSTMVGSTYYAAVKPLKKYRGADEIVDIPETDREVFGIVFLTSTDSKDYYNFSYKPMDETMGPCYYDCPESILKLLSPTDNEYAINWRKKCYEQIERKKKYNAFKKLPYGTVIKVIMPYDTKYFKKGDIIKLRKDCSWYGNRTLWMVVGMSVKFPSTMMRDMADCYEIIKEGTIL